MLLVRTKYVANTGSERERRAQAHATLFRRVEVHVVHARSGVAVRGDL